MDELITNERSRVLMIENIIDGGIQFGVLVRRHVRQIAGAIRARSQWLAVQQNLCTDVIRTICAGVIAKSHWMYVVRRVGIHAADIHGCRRNDPTGEDSRKVCDLGLTISWHSISVRVQDRSAIRIQQVGSD